LGFINIKTLFFPNKFLTPLSGTWHFSILGFTSAFEARPLENPKKLKNQKFQKENFKIAIFHLPQFEHEPFWQCLSRLNDYCAQYVHFTYEK